MTEEELEAIMRRVNSTDLEGQEEEVVCSLIDDIESLVKEVRRLNGPVF